MTVRGKILVLALGSEFRCDDGVGLAVLQLLRQQPQQPPMPATVKFVHHRGEPADLIERWVGIDVIAIDAMAGDVSAPSGSSKPGEIIELDLMAADVLAVEKNTSSHGLSLADALRLGRVLGKLPQSLQVVGITGACFDQGDTLSPEVQDATSKAMAIVLQKILAKLTQLGRAAPRLDGGVAGEEKKEMHEMSLMKNLLGQVENLAKEHQGEQVSRIKIWLGALSHFSKDHFQEHFDVVAKGSVAEGAELDMELSTDIEDPNATGVIIQEIDVDNG